jgi:hypothetical protein
VVLAALFGIGLVAGGAVLFALRSHGGHSSSKLVGAIMFWAFGAAVLVITWLLFRRARGGPRLRGVSISVERTEFARGDKVRGNLTLGARPAATEGLEIGLVCTAFVDTEREVSNGRGGHSTIRVIEPSVVVKQWHRITTGSPSQGFTFTIPADGPFSYEGETISWAYRISARHQRRGRSDPHTDVPIWVTP